MLQLSMKAGLKQFGKHGEDAVSKELNQLHLRDTFQPIDPKKLSAEERKTSWNPICFLKKKEM
jgi:hypothetical protein